MLAVAFFASLTDTRPDQHELTWEESAEGLSHSEKRATKGGRGFPPVRFREGAPRGSAGVVEISALVFDPTTPSPTGRDWAATTPSPSRPSVTARRIGTGGSSSG